MGSLETWRTVTLWAVGTGQTAFVLLYLSFPWWRSLTGRALFVKAVGLAVLVDVLLINRMAPIPHSDVLFTSLYVILAFGVWAQFFAFLQVSLGLPSARRDTNDQADDGSVLRSDDDV